MPIVCVSMELGALSKEVTEGLSRELALRQVYPEIVKGTAARIGAPAERVQRVVEGRASFLDRLSITVNDLQIYAGAQLTSLAALGNVAFRGWGAGELFRMVPHVANVRITAPFERRVDTVMQTHDNDDREQAVRAIRRSDAAYASALYRNGHHDAHHLVLNTDRCTVDDCVEQIVTLVRHPRFRDTEDVGRWVLADMALEANIRAALRRTHGTQSTRIWVRAMGSTVRLEGMVATAHERAMVEEVVASQPGVRNVNNLLRTMTWERPLLRTASF